MAGFFRQLAEQALSPAQRLHPVAAASQALTEGPEDLSEQISQPSNGFAMSIDAPSREFAVSQAIRASSAGPAFAGQTAVDAESPDTGRDATRTPGIRAVATQRPLQDETQHPRDPAHSPLLRSDQGALPERASVRLRSEAETTPSPRSPRHFATQRAPSPLRPIPVAAIRPPPPQARQDLRTSHTDNGAAPEVHIHIGRIELTALTQPAVRKREPAGGRKPMSLDEYLQQRGRKMS